MEKAISFKNVSKTYQSKTGPLQAVKDISFDIEKGEFFGLLGPNGAGKSTLINMLGGVVKQGPGEISVLGSDLRQDPIAIKHKIGIVPQEISFPAFINLEDTLRYQAGYYGQDVDEKYLEELLDLLKLADKRKTLMRMLSGGMKRRFMIARALIHKPQVVVLDEPTAGVDVELRNDLYDFTRKLNEQGTTIILTSHYLDEVELLCDRVAIINKGELVALDHKDKLKDRFQTSRIFSLALTECPKEIPKNLDRFNPKCFGSELQLTFEEHEYQDVLQAVSKTDLPISHFKVIEPKLEDVFLSLTKQQ